MTTEMSKYDGITKDRYDDISNSMDIEERLEYIQTHSGWRASRDEAEQEFYTACQWGDVEMAERVLDTAETEGDANMALYYGYKLNKKEFIDFALQLSQQLDLGGHMMSINYDDVLTNALPDDYITGVRLINECNVKRSCLTRPAARHFYDICGVLQLSMLCDDLKMLVLSYMSVGDSTLVPYKRYKRM